MNIPGIDGKPHLSPILNTIGGKRCRCLAGQGKATPEFWVRSEKHLIQLELHREFR